MRPAFDFYYLVLYYLIQRSSILLDVRGEVIVLVFKPGDKVCLWEVKSELLEGRITILKEVVVTIMETKTGVEGLPKNYQSLRAMTEDGQYYDKHWRYWPGTVVKLNEKHHWSGCLSGGSEGGKWIPQESVSVYNNAPKDRVKIVDISGKPIFPKEAKFCQQHGVYYYPDDDTHIICNKDKK